MQSTASKSDAGNHAELQQRLAGWIGKTQTMADRIDRSPLRRMAATLDRDDADPKDGDPIPPGWHWFYFLPDVPQSNIAADGHAAKGDFYPPIPFPRRMWAGSRMTFHRPLRVGETVRRISEISNVVIKEGRSGTLCFLTMTQTVEGEDGLATVEEQDIVYREEAKPGEKPPPPQPLPGEPVWERVIHPDPVLLFRFSALTFNGHRIHYDQPYVTQVEGYPGLIVHGPLLATLLLDLVRRNAPCATPKSFAFRALRPVFDISDFKVQGRRDGDTCAVWALDNEGHLAMTATVEL